MKHNIKLIIFLILSLSTGLKSQEVHFSQFFSAPLYLSPSFAGSTAGTRVAMNYRDQWRQFPGTFVSSSFSIDHNFRNMKSGLGLLVVGDNAGDGNLSTITTGLIYSYDIVATPDFHIRPGINFQYARTGINIGKLYDITNIGSGGTTNGTTSYKTFPYTWYFDFSSSVIAYTKFYWAGLTIDHLFKPNQALVTIDQQASRIPLKFSIYGGGRLFLSEDSHSKQEESITGVILYQKQSVNDQFNIGFYWTRTPIVIGFYYRGIPFGSELKGSDALVFMAGYKIEDLSIGYSFDYTISELAGAVGGSHELSLIYTFNKVPRQKKKKWAPVPCPTF